MLLSTASWADINVLRERIAASQPTSLEEAAREFTAAFVDTFESVVLARVFLILPLSRLPPEDRTIAEAKVGGGTALAGLDPPCLSLLASGGKEPAWNDRKQSRNHRAIPLVNREMLSDAPMLARLLADLDFQIEGAVAGESGSVRRMLGSQNGMFFVRDAQAERDAQGRAVIADQRFVSKHGVRTVFGMGGAYLAQPEVVVAVIFCTEVLERLIVDRYPSLISNLKMATASLLARGHIYDLDVTA